MSTLSSWADLPLELLSMIGNCLKTRIDNCRFRSVCTSWRSSTPLIQTRLQFGPGLHFKLDFFFMYSKVPVCFEYSEKTIYCVEPLTQPLSSTKYPWFVVVEEFEDGIVHLLDPFTGVRNKSLPSDFPTKLDLAKFHIIELQKLYRLELNVNLKKDRRFEYVPSHVLKYYMFRKMVFLQNPTYDDQPLLAVLSSDGHLSFFKMVTNEWILVRDTNGRRRRSFFRDIASYKGKVCAISDDGQAIIVDSSFNVTKIAKPGFSLGRSCKRYLVESSEDLYLVEKYDTYGDDCDFDDVNEFFEFEYFPIEIFCPLKVYKLHEEEHSWCEVTDLGGQIMFLGRENFPYWSFCVSSSQIQGFNGNCIFFEDETKKCSEESIHGCYHSLVHGSDNKINVLDMETGRCGLLGEVPGYANVFWPPPNWLYDESSSHTPSG